MGGIEAGDKQTGGKGPTSERECKTHALLPFFLVSSLLGKAEVGQAELESESSDRFLDPLPTLLPIGLQMSHSQIEAIQDWGTGPAQVRFQLGLRFQQLLSVFSLA